MGKYSNTFELKLADLTADVESKIGVFIMRNPKLTKVSYSKPYAGLITFTVQIKANENGHNYIELENDNGNKANMTEVLTIQQMIELLEEMEEILDEEK